MRKFIIGGSLAAAALAGVGVWSAGARAASSVANDFDTDTIGWGVASTKNRAAEKAEARCINAGGDINTVAWSKADGPGWASVYNATDGEYVTHSFRYSTKQKAKRKGKQFCETTDGGHSCELVKVFYDEFDPQKNGGQHLPPGDVVIFKTKF